MQAVSSFLMERSRILIRDFGCSIWVMYLRIIVAVKEQPSILL